MTTEIAVINRLGIALATDSAVTVSGGGHTKVFNSADKLFELSSNFPVAIMVNGNMDCFDLPWEIAIKDFRSEEGATSRNSIGEWATDFLNYVEKHKYIGNGYISTYIYQIARSEVNLIKQQILNVAWSQNKQNPRTVPDVAQECAGLFSSDRIDELKSIPIADSLKSFSVDDVLSTYNNLREFVESEFSPVEISEAAITSVVIQICHAALVIVQNEHSTGIIVAGYGVNETFPSLASYEVEGIVLGKLKYSAMSDIKSVQSKTLGHVVSFAQTDVIERLFSGVDPRFVEKSADFMRDAIIEIGAQVSSIGAKRRVSKKERAATAETISELAELSREKYVETATNLCAEFKREFEQMVAMMPKIELIELAEALVSITAIERKATPDEGTVGGPVDVAFVTKHEGFVWIKRKHYFDPALNPRYFWRKYNLGRGE